MTTHEYERPWQVMPAEIIKLALTHAQKDTDLDHQVAYLLFDIGVEAALKTFLVNRKHDVEYIRFPDLLKKVKDELVKSNPNLINQIEDVDDLHRTRNKLYHEGGGVMPTNDKLKRYSEIAIRIVKEIIDVDLEIEEKKYILTLTGQKQKRNIEELANVIRECLDCFHTSCAIVTEKLRPNYGTREFTIRLKWISESWPDDEEGNPRVRVANQECRLEKFNELTEKKQKNHNFVDFILEDVNHLYVIITLQEISDNVQEDWETYKNLLEKQAGLLSDWKQGIDSQRLSVEQVREEFEKINSWMKTQQGKLNEWINDNLDNIYGNPMPSQLIDWEDILG